MARRIPDAREIHPLLKKKFATTAYLFEEHAGKPNSKTTTRSLASPRVEGHQKIYDYEEAMLRAMEKIKVGGEYGMTTIPEKLWKCLKTFTSQVISSRRQSEKEIAKKRATLHKFKILQDLENEIAELKSYRIDLVRELAIDEKELANAFGLRQKTMKALQQTDMWARETRGLFERSFSCKRASDTLHSQLYKAHKYSMLTKTNPESIAPSGSGKNTFQEGRVVFRAPRVFCGRQCIVTIFVHDLQMSYFREDTPYAQPSITTCWPGNDADSAEGYSMGMSELLRSLLTEETPGGTTDQPTYTYLIVIQNVNAGENYMIEHLPNRDLDIHQMEESVIAHVNAHLTLAEDYDGTVSPQMAGTKHPLKRLWTGTQSIGGDRNQDLFQISVLELNVRTWLVRVYDGAVCKIYTHVLPKDLDANVEELLTTTLSRLHFYNGVLSMEQVTKRQCFGRSIGNRDDIKLEEVVLWPESLVVKVPKIFSDRIAMIQASLCSSKDIMEVVVSDYINKFVVSKRFCFSNTCMAFAAIEQQNEDPLGLVATVKTMGKMARSFVEIDGSEVTDVKNRCSAGSVDTNAFDEESLRSQIIVYGVTAPEYKKAMTVLLDRLQLKGEKIFFPPAPVMCKKSPTLAGEKWTLLSKSRNLVKF